MQILKPIYPMV